jgi:hypothetical protein
MVELAGRLEDLRSPDAILVGDCKLCTIDTLAEAAELGFPLITLAPENFSWKAEFVGQASKDPDLPLLLTTGDDGEYRGKSWRFSVLFEIPGRPPRTATLRCLAVYSSQLAKKKQETRIRSMKKELTSLNTFATKIAD